MILHDAVDNRETESAAADARRGPEEPARDLVQPVRMPAPRLTSTTAAPAAGAHRRYGVGREANGAVDEIARPADRRHVPAIGGARVDRYIDGGFLSANENSHQSGSSRSRDTASKRPPRRR